MQGILALWVFKNIYLASPGLNRSMWDLVPWPGIDPGPLNLSHWTTREIPDLPLWNHKMSCWESVEEKEAEKESFGNLDI